MPAYRIITNPVSGRGNGARAEAIIDRAFGRAGVAYELTETRAPHDATRLAREAIQRGFDVIVAVGGDGTVHEVVNGLLQAARERPDWESGAPAGTLGVVPLGTGNDFAWYLGLPEHDPEAACRLVLADHRRVIDVGQITDEHNRTWVFDNNLGAGFDAATTVESYKIRNLRGFPLYLLAVLRTIPKYSRAPEVVVHYNGKTLARPMLMVSAANGRRTGGGFMIAPDAVLDDGLLELTLAGSPNIPTILRLLPHFIRGTHKTQTRHVTVDRTAHLVLEAPTGVPVHLDGEIIRTDARRLEVSILPRRLRVITAPLDAKSAR